MRADAAPIAGRDSEPDGAGDETGNAGYLADATFANAFREEYGLTPAQMTEAVAECIDWATERGTPVFVVTRAALTARLTTRRVLATSDVDALLVAFGLAARPRWDATPTGYSGADWYPWRFRRRLSLLARPFVLLDTDVLNPDTPACGDTPGTAADDAAPAPSAGPPAGTPTDGGRVVLDAALLVAGLSYLVSGLRAGWFQQGFVSSRAMKRYLGAAADRLGAAFTERVANVCRAAGWQARTEVNMTQLGARSEFGDVDVIAWREGDPRLLCIECKRLRPARSVYEITEVLTRFRGQAKDLLARHLTRIAWLREHRPTVARGLRAPVEDREITPLLVTNVVVPMQFTTDLPAEGGLVVAVGSLPAVLAASADTA